jgi:hypothetical protein
MKPFNNWSCEFCGKDVRLSPEELKTREEIKRKLLKKGK